MASPYVQALPGFLECWSQYMGDHVHHGFYEQPVDLPNVSVLKDDPNSVTRLAAMRMIDELLEWANVSDYDLQRPCNILDVGCGMGGVCRYVATKLGRGGSIQGISKRTAEIEKAQQMTAAANLSHKVRFIQGDAMDLPFPENTYDVVICVEYAGHIRDKEKLVSELVRVMKPGSRLVFSTLSCPEGASDLTESDKETMQQLSDKLMVPMTTPLSCYVGLAQEHGLQAIKTDILTEYVVPGIKIASLIFNDANVSEDSKYKGVFQECVDDFELLLKGYTGGLVLYTILSATKPAPSS